MNEDQFRRFLACVPTRTTEAQSDTGEPQHPFEVTIRIGGNDWEYVTRTLHQLATHIEQHGADCAIVSGGWGGAHSVTIAKRDVTAEQYREELKAWGERRWAQA